MSGQAQVRPVCPGCGVALQSRSEDEPGFVPPAKLNKLSDDLEGAEAVLCRRCWRLAHYGELDAGDVPSKEAAMSAIASALLDCDSVWLLVDLTDVGVSLLPDVLQAVSSWTGPLVVIGTKYDLLPEVAVANEVQDWLFDQARAVGLTPSTVILSGLKSAGRQTAEGFQVRESLPPGGKVALVGTTNVGKSTLVNRLSRGARKGPLVAKLPGTTRGLLPVEVEAGRDGWARAVIVDTPGIPVGRARAQNGLGARCASELVTAKALQSRLERLSGGEAVLLGGMGAVALAGEAEDATLLIYVPDSLRLHKTQASRWQALWDAHAGEWLVPPGSRCRSLLERRGFVVDQVRVRPYEDIELGGLGWVSVRGRLSEQSAKDGYVFSVTTPSGTLVRTRTALLQPRKGIGGNMAK